MRGFLAFFLIITSTWAFTQKYPFYDNYKWDKAPVLCTMEVPNALYFYSKYTLAVEYEYDLYNGKFFKYETLHYRVKLNSHVAIEEFNKVYISMEDAVSLKSLKARVIKPSGVVDIKPKVEEFYSDKESEQYYYFPVSGIELGDEIEILYTLKMESAVDGDQYFFQSEVPVFNFDFYFISPNDSYFDFLAHNGFPQPDLVDTILHKHQWIAHMDTIPAFKAEYFSEYNNVTMKLDMTLRGFNSPSDDSYSPFTNFESDLNAVYNRVHKGKDLKAVKSLSESLGLNPRKKVEENVRTIENYIKQNISINSSVPYSTPLATVIQNEKGGAISTIILYMALFQENDIEFEYGFISDRYETHFSDQIESMKFLHSYIFYFPKIDKYLAPLDFGTRLGYLDNNWIPNNALLMTMKQYPKPLTKGKVKPVPSTTARQNVDSTIVRIKVSDTFDKFEIEIERHLFGYDAGEIQAYYYIYNDARREEEEEALLDVLNDNSMYKTISIQNVAPEDAFVKPLIIKGVVTELYAPLIERAGNRMIFKLGFLFGEYTDLKEIEKKKTDFVFGNPFCASKRIEVEFPQGVKIFQDVEIPESEDMFPHEGLRIYSDMNIEGNRLTYTEGSIFESNRYSIEDKDVMIQIFTFWNMLHKMNLVIEKG